MTGIKKTASTETLKSPEAPQTPKLSRKWAYPPDKAPEAAAQKTIDPAPSKKVQRPMMIKRPSMSLFQTEHSFAKNGYRFSVSGNCQSCMAMARDAYDKMHAQHVIDESKASGN